MSSSRTLQVGPRRQGPEAGVGFRLWQVSNQWQAAQRAALGPLGLTHARFAVLASLASLEDGDPITQRQLAEHVELDQMTTSQLLRALEADGLVERRHHPADGRARTLHTTSAGRKLAREAAIVVENCDGRFFAPLREEPVELEAMLKALAEPWVPLPPDY